MINSGKINKGSTAPATESLKDPKSDGNATTYCT